MDPHAHMDHGSGNTMPGMDHGHMDHGHMDHGHMGDEPMMCNMNMLFTWDTSNLCIVFSSWRISSAGSLIWSLAAVVALTAGYEAVREASRKYELKLERRTGGSGGLRLPNTENNENNNHPSALHPNERSSLLRIPGTQISASEEQKGKLIKAMLYGVQVFYSFFIMLLFMTYNGWIMIAVGVGAMVGYLMFSGPGTSSSKSAACH
ncbi:Copper transport protein [Cercospora zeina]